LCSIRLLLRSLILIFASNFEISEYIFCAPFAPLFIFYKNLLLAPPGPFTYKRPKLSCANLILPKSPFGVTIRNQSLRAFKYLPGYYLWCALAAQIDNNPKLRSSRYGSRVRASNGKRSGALALYSVRFTLALSPFEIMSDPIKTRITKKNILVITLRTMAHIIK